MYNNKETSEENKLETDYMVSYTANVSYADIIDKISIDQQIDTFTTETSENLTTISGTNYTYNKQLRVLESEFKKVLGENGSISILNGETVLATITKDTPVTDGYYIVDVTNYNVNNIRIETSKPEKEGSLSIDIFKSIAKDIDYSKNQINNFTNIKTSVIGRAYNEDIAISEISGESLIKLEEPTQKASITAKGDSIIGTSRAGGLCGELDGTIESCYNFGDIMATAISESPYAGGLVGYNKGTIAESYNAGKVKSEGSGLSLSDVYAGGIAAFGENGSSITNCAVMSPEINVTIGYINNGYKYIIANGGSKSNNISINNIVGAPTNDSNSQYTQDEMKTTSPYSGFDFYNKWMISENFNNGYPFHYINNYVNIAIQDIIVPQKLNFFINNNFISINDLKQTSDGFTLCTKPLSEIFSDMGIDEIRTDQYNEEGELQTFELADLDDWYIFSVANTCSILKMRNGIGKTKGGEDPGTAIPFIELDLDLIKLFYEDLQQQTEESENELQYNGYIIVPSEISTDQEEFLLTLPDIYDEENERIKVDAGNLTLDEKHAILVCRTGNQSLNNYAAENFLHARYTVIIGDFLQGTDEILELDDEIMDRAAALVKFDASIKADAGVGEESFSKEMIIIKGYENMLDSKYGNV